jgi:hypothetical protein
MKRYIKRVLAIFTVTSLIGCSSSDLDRAISIDFKSTKALNNKSAYITSQCYTKTFDNRGNSYNPCFSCHINSEEPNYINDYALQESYDFSDYSKTNRFTNLFKDRTKDVAKISDEEILEYIRVNNYLDKSGNLILSSKLKEINSEWDVNSDGKWGGYIPDCYFNFDSEGFDIDRDGEFTGWRAFGYYPFLGTFWPTNGSFDDVLIRLPIEFRLDKEQNFSKEIYRLNLAIVESLIKQKDIQIEQIDESRYGVDLNQDGLLSTTNIVKFNWEKPEFDIATNRVSNFSMSYVGYAKELLESNEYLIAPSLYPKGTEFLHSVRYLDFNKNRELKLSARMKELRYGKKTNWNSYAQLQQASNSEIMEKELFPERLRTIKGNSEDGLENGLGWIYQGFIEDSSGELRPQNYEETLYCIGCHSGIGAITDSTFVFQRKFDFNALQNGWYHWSQKSDGLKNIAEPKRDDEQFEYTLYLEQNGAGDEFRSNKEVIDKFFDSNRGLKSSEIDTLHSDISHLLLPSYERALNLNKAYRVIVDEQSFIYGRDAHIEPLESVYREVEESSTGLDAIFN